MGRRHEDRDKRAAGGRARERIGADAEPAGMVGFVLAGPELLVFQCLRLGHAHARRRPGLLPFHRDKVATPHALSHGRVEIESGARAGGRGPRLTLPCRAGLRRLGSRPPGVRGRTGRSASWGEGLPPKLDVQGPELVAAVDGELHCLAGLLVGDHRAELVDRRDGDAVDLDDEVTAERPGVAGERHLLRRAAQAGAGRGAVLAHGCRRAGPAAPAAGTASRRSA